MLARRDREASRPSQYSGTGAPRLCWRWRGLGAVAALCCGLAAAGCSFQLNSLLSKDEADGDVTGSIGRPQQRADRAAAAARQPSESDLAYASAAASDALAHSGKDSSHSFRQAFVWKAQGMSVETEASGSNVPKGGEDVQTETE